MKTLIKKAAVLIEALPYIQEFRNNVVVVKFGGSAMEDPERTRSVLRDIVFMECAGMKPVVVHGGGKAITARLQELDIPSRFVHGLRYTCEKTVKVVDDVLHNTINAELVQEMTRLGGRPCPVSGRNVLRAERVSFCDPDTGGEEDLGFVGEVVNVDTEQLHWILNREDVPIITPLGRDMQDRIYNINADMAACRIAAALQASKLVFLSDVPGILRAPEDESSLISTVLTANVESLIDDGIIAGGMIPKIRSAVRAIEEGVDKVHLIDGRLTHSLLLEIFTDKGIGTQIVQQPVNHRSTDKR